MPPRQRPQQSNPRSARMGDAHIIQSLREISNCLPRFLFRGFHAATGGAIDGLNGPSEIVPHAFLASPELSRVPSDLTVDQLQGLADEHFLGYHTGSRFSSWAANFESAVHFALGGPVSHMYDQDWLWFEENIPRFRPRYIAIIDTHTIPEPERFTRVIHLPNIGIRAPVEYLIYGPLRTSDGVDLRVVDIDQIRRSVMCSMWPRCPARLRMPHAVSKRDVREAAAVASCFVKRPGDLTENQDVPMAVLAAELGRMQWPTPPPSSSRIPEQELIRDFDWTVQDLNVIRKYVPQYIPTKLSATKLATPDIIWIGFAQLKLMQELLHHLDGEPLPRTPPGGPDSRDLELAEEIIRQVGLMRPDIPEDTYKGPILAACNRDYAAVHDCNDGGRVEMSGRESLSFQYDTMTHNRQMQFKNAVIDQPVQQPTFGLRWDLSRGIIF